MKPIEICKKDLSKELFENILFCMFAEGGAMGEMGAIYFVKSDGKLYTLNYLWGDVRLDEVLELFPTLAKCEFGICGIGSTVPEGWNYVNLGAGNHLIVKDNVYPKFWQLTKDYKRLGEIYRDWIDHANYILNGKKMKKKKITYFEPADYFPKEIREKRGIGEYATSDKKPNNNSINDKEKK